MQACTHIHALWDTQTLLMHNILIPEGKGDRGRMKAHWKESQTLHETISKETNKDSAWQADSS